MTDFDIEEIYEAIRNTECRGEQPDTIIFSAPVYNRMFVRMKIRKVAGNAHDRRKYLRAAERRNAGVDRLREYMGLTSQTSEAPSPRLEETTPTK